MAFLDADDLWAPEKLALQLRVFEDDESIDAVFGLVQQFLSDDADPLLAGKVVIPSASQPGIIEDGDARQARGSRRGRRVRRVTPER